MQCVSRDIKKGHFDAKKGQLDTGPLLQEGFLSTMIPDTATLEQYWETALQELPIPLLDGHPELYHRAIPIVIWGDEATPNRSSWMLATWNFDLTCKISYNFLHVKHC